jgi:hypothetical protein
VSGVHAECAFRRAGITEATAPDGDAAMTSTGLDGFIVQRFAIGIHDATVSA